MPQSCTVAQEAADQPWRRRNVCLPAAAPSAPWSNDRHDLRGIEDGGRAVAPCRCHPAPQPSFFRSPAIRTEAGKPRFSPAKRCASPQTGIRSPLPAVLALHLSPTAKAPRPVPGTTRDPTGKIAEGRSGRWVIGQARAVRRRAIQKRPPRAESGKGVSNDLWQRPTFPHDVMQYHRRWRA